MASQPIADPRPVVRCPSCRLNQFETVSKNCRRCREPLYVAAEEEAVAEVDTVPDLVSDPLPVEASGVHGIQIGRAIRIARLSAGITQVQLADRLGTTRQWFTKIENGFKSPLVASLIRVADAIGCSPRLLIELALA